MPESTQTPTTAGAKFGGTAGAGAVLGYLATDYLQRRFGLSPEAVVGALGTAAGTAGLLRGLYLKVKNR